MANFKWLLALVGKKKSSKGNKESTRAADSKIGTRTLRVKIECSHKSPEAEELRSSSFSVPVPLTELNNCRCEVKVLDHESRAGVLVEEAAYEGGDEHDEVLSMKREHSDFDLQAHIGNSNVEHDQLDNQGRKFLPLIHTRTREKDVECVDVTTPTGHVSDPGIRKAEFWASPKLQRSCSNLETRTMLKVVDKVPSKAQSFKELQRLAKMDKEEVLLRNPGSPVSVLSRGSADKVMLKKHSSSQILPSRSRKLWWRLFLWSHRNLQAVWTAKSQLPPTKHAFNQQGGYCSDTLEPTRDMELGKLGPPFTKESPVAANHQCHQDWGSLSGGASGLWPQNQWVAFSAESSTFTRVEEWVKDIPTEPPLPTDDEHRIDDGIVFPRSPETNKSIARSTSRLTMHDMNLPEEIQYANNIIQSLNSSSAVAHIAGIGLKAIPIISCFASLRSVNLSGNLIVYITPGSLPKGLHSLNLSKNKINTIEGLRDLTRLKMLDLSYNRISRIGQGLSNCTLIKELYLAGNKISDIEGLHRLLKLTILDLSFNKITTTKALGQLVANYNSLLALNLLGNPVQTNISDDQLRKSVCGLLPKLAYLNKQFINQHKAREVHTEAIAKAALGNSGWNPRRKAIKRVGTLGSQGGSSHSSGHRSGGSLAQKSRPRSRTRTHQQNTQKGKSLAVASSSH